MAKATQQKHAEHVRALGDEGLARLVKALAFDIPRMQGLLAIARREARRRKRAASALAVPAPLGGKNDRAAIAAARAGRGASAVSQVRAKAGRGSSPGASDAGNTDRDFCVVSGGAGY